MLNKIRKNLIGFSLIELLVSISIIALISVVFMVNYHSTNKRSELNVAKQKLASDIRLAQNYSLGSKTYDGVNTPSGGWGVHFVTDASDYIIFADGGVVIADPNGNHVYDVGEDIETKTLPAGVTISSLSPADTFDIVFFPPNPDIYIYGRDVFDLQAAEATIDIKENINNSTATVTVNYFGLIDTQ